MAEYGFTEDQHSSIFWLEADTFTDFLDRVESLFSGCHVDEPFYFLTVEKDSKQMNGWKINDGELSRYCNIDRTVGLED